MTAFRVRSLVAVHSSFILASTIAKCAQFSCQIVIESYFSASTRLWGGGGGDEMRTAHHYIETGNESDWLAACLVTDNGSTYMTDDKIFS